MKSRQIITIIAIFLIASAGWWILGTATSHRSTDFSHRLAEQVAGLYGTPIVQKAPAFAVRIPGSDRERRIMPAKNDIRVELETDYRRKGLIWYPTYICRFTGRYTIANPEPVTQKIRMHFDFPDSRGTYDAFTLAADGKALNTPVDTRAGVSELFELPPGERLELMVGYHTRGMGSWRYLPDHDSGRVRELNLVVETNFKDVDFTGLSPMETSETATGRQVIWRATDLLTRSDMGIIIPGKRNPGPLTTRITFFAPVCLIFFFVLIATLHVMYKVAIHPMHYLFVAAGFFAFHLLLSYLVGIINIHAAFLIAAAVSVSLVTGYLSTALGGRFPYKIAMAGQLFYLILFSYSFFLTGITGLTVAIGSVLTLAVLMKVTAHVDWHRFYGEGDRAAKTDLEWDIG